MSASENEALVRRFLEEAYNRGNLAVGDELLAPDCVFYAPAPILGIAGWKQFATAFLTAVRKCSLILLLSLLVSSAPLGATQATEITAVTWDLSMHIIHISLDSWPST